MLLDGTLRDSENHPNGVFFEKKIFEKKRVPSFFMKKNGCVAQEERTTIDINYVESPEFLPSQIKKITVGSSASESLETNIRGFLRSLNYPEEVEVERFSSSYLY